MRRFEDWEFAYALVLGTGAAIDYYLQVGPARIEAQVKYLAGYLRTALGKIDGGTSYRRFAVLDYSEKKRACLGDMSVVVSCRSETWQRVCQTRDQAEQRLAAVQHGRDQSGHFDVACTVKHQC